MIFIRMHFRNKKKKLCGIRPMIRVDLSEIQSIPSGFIPHMESCITVES